MNKNRVILLALGLLLFLPLSGQEESDVLKIKKMNMKEVTIGSEKKTVNSTFRLNEIIHWSGKNGSIYAQNLRTKEYFIFTQDAFESKSAGSVADYILTCKASTRGSSGKIRYGHNKDKFGGEKRVALLIGNSNYLNDVTLKNPILDVSAVSDHLVEYGFDTYTYFDCTSNQMRSAISQFRNKAQGSNVALFYYAGHGITWDKKNYYLPVDVELDKIESLNSCIEGYSLLSSLQADDRITLFLLDACRVRKSSWARGADDVRVQMEAPRNTAIVFSTTDGSYALDGDNELSPFAEGFIDSLEKGSVSFTDFSSNINGYVFEKTGHHQNSSLSSGLMGTFYFSSPTERIIPPASPKPAQQPSRPVSATANAGQYANGVLLYNQGDYSGAFKIMLPLAESGYTDAYFYVADMYHRGYGVKKDRDEAEKWYKKAAAAGNSKAKKILIDRF
jgi:hypothetical protein